jgi:hypothetical protein
MTQANIPVVEFVLVHHVEKVYLTIEVTVKKSPLPPNLNPPPAVIVAVT